MRSGKRGRYAAHLGRGTTSFSAPRPQRKHCVGDLFERNELVRERQNIWQGSGIVVAADGLDRHTEKQVAAKLP